MSYDEKAYRDDMSKTPIVLGSLSLLAVLALTGVARFLLADATVMMDTYWFIVAIAAACAPFIFAFARPKMSARAGAFILCLCSLGFTAMLYFGRNKVEVFWADSSVTSIARESKLESKLLGDITPSGLIILGAEKSSIIPDNTGMKAFCIDSLAKSLDSETLKSLLAALGKSALYENLTKDFASQDFATAQVELGTALAAHIKEGKRLAGIIDRGIILVTGDSSDAALLKVYAEIFNDAKARKDCKKTIVPLKVD